MKRRQFLTRASWAAASALAAGCGGSASESTAAPAPVAGPAPTPAPVPAASPGPAPSPAPPSASGLPSPSFFAMPSLANERATYDLLGWARTASDEAFGFVSNPGVIGSLDVHADPEMDDLWVWANQVDRGHGTTAVNWKARWLTYYKNQYLTDFTTDNSDAGYKEPDQGYDHAFGTGLVHVGVVNNDPSAIAAAEAIADVVITNWLGPLPGNIRGGIAHAGGRRYARHLLLFTYLAQATNKTKWIDWRNAMMQHWLDSPDWAEYPSLGITSGGHYFVNRFTYAESGNWNSTGTTANWDAGRRLNNSFEYGIIAEAFWRVFLATGRSDVAARIVKMANFVLAYGHHPSHTNKFCDAYFGIEAGGSRYSRSSELSSSALYDAFVVNTLVMGYKLTGNVALLDRAKVHFRQGTRWAEGQPGASAQGPLVAANEVWKFVDTQPNPEEIFFTNGKGQLFYTYLLFENGGQPSIIGSQPPPPPPAPPATRPGR